MSRNVDSPHNPVHGRPLTERGTATSEDVSASGAPLAGERGFDVARAFQENVQYVWRVLRYLGVREADVEDVCQEVFVVAHRRAADFRGDASVRTWLYGIAVRLASEHRRRAVVRREVPTAQTPDRVLEPGQDDAVARRQTREQLLVALEQMEERRRQVFVLYEIEEAPMKEVADALELPLQTAYSRLHAARKELEQHFRELERTRPTTDGPKDGAERRRAGLSRSGTHSTEPGSEVGGAVARAATLRSRMGKIS